jgi:parallel beta-helix repeat protein
MLVALSISSIKIIVPLESDNERSFVIESEKIAAEYTVSIPIAIDGNQDFEDQATANSWPGDGSSDFPYIIRNLSISSGSDTVVLVNITNTNVYFQFRDSLLSGGLSGISFLSVSHGFVINNTIEGSAETGIYGGECDFISVENNTLKDADTDAHGLYWHTVQDSIIKNNTVIDNGERGLLLDYCTNCSILENTVFGNGDHGINLRDANTIHIENNTIYSNAIDGIEFGNCPHCNVTRNYIYNNGFRGVDGAITHYLLVMENIIVGNPLCGASTSGDHSSIINNTFYSNTLGGVAIEATDVTVTWNNFIDNKDFETASQVIDRGTGNNIDYNYYDDWTWPDEDPIDGIVDDSYFIVGDAFNFDAHPRVMIFPNDEIHIVTKPMIVCPLDTGLPYHTEINITWGPSSDTFGHDITYSINYSTNAGVDWIELASDLDQTYCIWNITQVPESENYTLRITATCSDGLSAVRELPFQFTILHHTVSTPNVVFPNGGETISEPCSIEWQWTQCVYNHPINYTIYYSSDGGATWHLIAANVTETMCPWDNSGLDRGSHYLIKVVAKCNESAVAEDVSDAEFSLVEPVTTTTPPTTTTIPTNTTTTSPEQPYMLVLLVGFGVATVVVVIVVVALKRRP